MTGVLTHSPADIIRQLLIDLSLGTASGTWPVYVSQEPDLPDNVITTFDTAGIHDGRHMPGGEVQEHNGVQIRVRSANHAAGYTKAQTIAATLDTSVKLTAVTANSVDYQVISISRRGSVIALSKNVPTSNRDVLTLNILPVIIPV